MTSFVSSLHNYFMVDVLEKFWSQLLADLKAADSIDEICKAHESYVAQIYDSLFLCAKDRETFKLLTTTLKSIHIYTSNMINIYTDITNVWLNLSLDIEKIPRIYTKHKRKYIEAYCRNFQSKL